MLETDISPNISLSEDLWVKTPQGALFARVWPAGEGGGDRAPILLFHDSLGCVDLWRGFPAVLRQATGRRVIAYDRLGFGRSDPRGGEMPFTFVGEEAEHTLPLLMAQLGFERFVAFGHSVGGGMATHCAAWFPDLCAALITESAQSYAEDETLEGIAAAAVQFRDEAQMDRLRKYHGDKAEWVLGAWTKTWLRPEFKAWSLRDVLPRVTCPVLAMHGDKDEYGTLRHPEIIVEHASGPARLEVMRDSHHVPHREQEEAVVRLVSEFLEGV